MDKLKSTTSRQSIRGGTQKTYASQIDKQESKSDDPRIDSPEISVVYPSITHDLPLFTEAPKMDETKTEPTTEENKGEEKHECKVDWMTALKQNGSPFLLLALLLLLLGYALGKRA